jgi:hypothetical protein
MRRIDWELRRGGKEADAPLLRPRTFGRIGEEFGSRYGGSKEEGRGKHKFCGQSGFVENWISKNGGKRTNGPMGRDECCFGCLKCNVYVHMSPSKGKNPFLLIGR